MFLEYIIHSIKSKMCDGNLFYLGGGDSRTFLSTLANPILYKPNLADGTLSLVAIAPTRICPGNTFACQFYETLILSYDYFVSLMSIPQSSDKPPSIIERH